MNSCSCRDTMDIRGRCDPFFRKQFKVCSVKIDTALWFIENDREFHDEFHNEKKRKGFHTKHFKRLFGTAINKDEGLLLLSQAYHEDEEDEEEEEDKDTDAYTLREHMLRENMLKELTRTFPVVDPLVFLLNRNMFWNLPGKGLVCMALKPVSILYFDEGDAFQNPTLRTHNMIKTITLKIKHAIVIFN